MTYKIIIMNLELKQRFPIQYNMFEEMQTVRPTTVTYGQIEYDSSRVSHIHPDILQLFINYQKYYPSKINECIEIFCSILELQENEHNLKELTGNQVNKNIVHYRQKKTNEYMQQIYEVLQWEYHVLMGKSLLEPAHTYIIDNWISFIKSQMQIKL